MGFKVLPIDGHIIHDVVRDLAAPQVQRSRQIDGSTLVRSVIIAGDQAAGQGEYSPLADIDTTTAGPRLTASDRTALHAERALFHPYAAEGAVVDQGGVAHDEPGRAAGGIHRTAASGVPGLAVLDDRAVIHIEATQRADRAAAIRPLAVPDGRAVQLQLAARRHIHTAAAMGNGGILRRSAGQCAALLRVGVSDDQSSAVLHQEYPGTHSAVQNVAVQIQPHR